MPILLALQVMSQSRVLAEMKKTQASPRAQVFLETELQLNIVRIRYLLESIDKTTQVGRSLIEAERRVKNAHPDMEIALSWRNVDGLAELTSNEPVLPARYAVKAEIQAFLQAADTDKQPGK